jgi:hypothetical protein
MATELPAEGPRVPAEAGDGRLDEIAGEGGDLDDELGEDIALDDQEDAA